MRKGDYVVHILNTDAMPARIIDIVDMGYGKGNERVEIELLGLRRFYAKKELKVVQNAV